MLTMGYLLYCHDDVIKKHLPHHWPFVRGIHRWPPPVTGGFPSQRPLMLNFDVSFGLSLNKESIGGWQEMSWRSFDVTVIVFHKYCIDITNPVLAKQPAVSRPLYLRDLCWFINVCDMIHVSIIYILVPCIDGKPNCLIKTYKIWRLTSNIDRFPGSVLGNVLRHF